MPSRGRSPPIWLRNRSAPTNWRATPGRSASRSRARSAEHAGALYQAGASDAVPETLESSLQLAEAVLIDLGVAMGPVIASIHDVRAKMRHDIMTKGQLDHEPRIRRTRRHAPDGEAA